MAVYYVDWKNVYAYSTKPLLPHWWVHKSKERREEELTLIKAKGATEVVVGGLSYCRDPDFRDTRPLHERDDVVTPTNSEQFLKMDWVKMNEECSTDRPTNTGPHIWQTKPDAKSGRVDLLADYHLNGTSRPPSPSSYYQKAKNIWATLPFKPTLLCLS